MKLFDRIQSKNFFIALTLGFAIAFVLVTALILSVNNPNPVWGKNWFVRPILLTPVIAATGAGVSYLISTISFRNQLFNLFKILLCLLAYIFFLWIGTVIGFNGTLWN